MPLERAVAFAPGRVNLIGEHTDYNRGLALPFAIAEGVTVRAESYERKRADADEHPGEGLVRVSALALDERDSFPLVDPPRADGWRAFVRGTVAELGAVGALSTLSGARLEIGGDLEQGAGLSSSAALEVALCLALGQLGGSAPTENRETFEEDVGADRKFGMAARARVRADISNGKTLLDRTEIARLCARVENRWAGAQTGLLDQLASLFGEPEMALLIDFDSPIDGHSLRLEPVPLRLGGWQLVTLDSGERHTHRSSGYNERREECRRACELLGIESLRQAGAGAIARLPSPLQGRARHVMEENGRVLAAVDALQAEDLPALGALLNASHASLRDLYEVSTPAVEATVARLLEAGARGARLTGGGFGGSVLGLFPPDAPTPGDAREVRPGPGAHLVDAAALQT